MAIYKPAVLEAGFPEHSSFAESCISEHLHQRRIVFFWLPVPEPHPEAVFKDTNFQGKCIRHTIIAPLPEAISGHITYSVHAAPPKIHGKPEVAERILKDLLDAAFFQETLHSAVLISRLSIGSYISG